MGDNKCATCGQWAGKGHHCPTLAPVYPVADYVSLPVGDRHPLRREVADRVSRAVAHLRPMPPAKPLLPKQPPLLKRDTEEWERFERLYLDDTHMTETKAQMMATELHKGQTDYSGVNYIDHPRGVLELMKETPEYEALTPEQRSTARVAAILHDTIEDTALEEGDLTRAGCSDEEIRAIMAVTSRDGEAKSDYYARIKAAGPVAVAVKIGDLSHNNLPERRATLPGAPGRPVADGEEDRYTKLGRKYWIAYTALGAEVPEHLREFAPIDA